MHTAGVALMEGALSWVLDGAREGSGVINRSMEIVDTGEGN